jgi:hypothetical protein
MNAYPPTNRRLVAPELPPDLTENYDDAEFLDNHLRQETVDRHADLVALWVFAWRLFTDAFFRDATIRMTIESPAEKVAFPLRVQLLMLSGRASKPALDLTLSAHYSEAWALLRSMLEGWIRATYVRVLPAESGRWYVPEEETLESTPLREPLWSKAATAIKTYGDDRDRKRIADAQPRWKGLNIGVHPSGEAITQTLGDRKGVHEFQPSYDENFCLTTFSHGLFVQQSLLYEIAGLELLPDEWLGGYVRFAKMSDPVIALAEDALREKYGGAS